MNSEIKAGCFKFRNFTLDLEQRLLLRDGEPVPLTPKAFDTLALLVRRSGRVVGKDELLEEIWPDAFVEEGTLAQNVFTLRKALGQTPTENQFIATVPKRGYRFIADVEVVDGATNAKPEIGRHRAAHDIVIGGNGGGAGIGVAETIEVAGRGARANENGGGDSATARVAAEAASHPPTASRRELHSEKQHGRFNFRLKLLAPMTLLLAAAVAAGLFLFTRINEPAPDFAAPSPHTRTAQLTNTGQVLRAAVSPDGKYVAYIQSDRGQESLWLRQVAIAGGIEIVRPSDSHFVGITFSPDSGSIFYVKYGRDSAVGSLYQVPALGGAGRKILRGIDSQISFAPDKKRFAFVRNDLSRKESHLIVANLDAAEQRHLAVHASVHWMTDGAPAWSPDGKMFVAERGTETGDIVLINK